MTSFRMLHAVATQKGQLLCQQCNINKLRPSGAGRFREMAQAGPAFRAAFGCYHARFPRQVKDVANGDFFNLSANCLPHVQTPSQPAPAVTFGLNGAGIA